MKNSIRSIPSPVSHVIFPGTIHTVGRPNTGGKVNAQSAHRAFLEEWAHEEPTKQAIFPGTLHSSFEPLTKPVSVTETEVRRVQAQAERAIAQGKIPPRAEQGRFLDEVI